jgi:hypothetical protein
LHATDGKACAGVLTVTVTDKGIMRTAFGFSVSKSVGIWWLILALLFIGLMASCTKGGNGLDFDKIDAFEAMFPVGMPKLEVEAILENLEDVTFRGQKLNYFDCAVWASYSTAEELYGSAEFKFCYGSDMKLKQVFYTAVE